jgi:NAD(P)-dependent dehydrogenase (short-subunit alcohol dehydrogenase family)
MTTTQDKKLALVIGATGGIGGAVAERLLAGGWRVRALHRNPQAARRTAGRPGLEWVQGDAMVEADVVAAAQGVSLVMHGANPPGYRNWAGLQLPPRSPRPGRPTPASSSPARSTTTVPTPFRT